MLAWTPYEDLGWPEDQPVNLELEVWSGDGTPPSSLARVEFYVVPYNLSSPAVEIIRRMPSLRVVQTQTAGVEHVMPFVRDGITLCNARGVHDASTAELAVALTLASVRRLPEFVRAREYGEWASGTFPALADTTVLILGYGSIGAAIERRLAGFEVEVERVANTARDSSSGPVHGANRLPDLVPNADVVISVLPATPATTGMIDEAFFSRMKDGAVFVNVGRGTVVDTAALIEELRAGRLRAALDVTNPEPPPPGHPLWTVPNLLISPHVGGATTAFAPRARRLVREQLARFARSEPLANVTVGPAVTNAQ